MPFAGFTCFAKRFARDEGGAITVEAVLWIPFFFLVLMLITDASLAFFAKAQAFRTIEDGNRSFSVGTLGTTTLTASAIQTRFRTLSPTATAATTYDSATRIITSTLRFPVQEVTMFRMLGLSGGSQITVTAQQYKEWVP